MEVTRLSLVLLAVILASANAVSFFVEGNEKKCFNEDVQKDTLVVGTYSVGEGMNQEIDIQVFDPSNKQLFSKQNVDEGKFAFTSVVPGDHIVCFVNRLPEGMVAQAGMKRKINLDVKTGVDARDYSEVAKKENLKPLEVQLKKMTDIVADVHSEILYLRHREATHRNTNESTNARVMWFSIFSLCWLVGLGAWQVLYLKRYFKSKKLI